MGHTRPTVDGSEIRRSPVEVGSFFDHHLQDVGNPRWCRISHHEESENSTHRSNPILFRMGLEPEPSGSWDNLIIDMFGLLGWGICFFPIECSRDVHALNMCTSQLYNLRHSEGTIEWTVHLKFHLTIEPWIKPSSYTFHHNGCLIGTLVMVYYGLLSPPHNWVVQPYTLTKLFFSIAQLTTSVDSQQYF